MMRSFKKEYASYLEHKYVVIPFQWKGWVGDGMMNLIMIALQTKLKIGHLIANKEPIDTTPHVIQEMLQGCRNEQEYTGVYEQLIMDSEVWTLPDQQQAAVDAAEIYRNCKSSGMFIRKPYDCLIALTAMRYNLVLLHRDTDFINISKVYPSLLQIHFFDS